MDNFEGACKSDFSELYTIAATFCDALYPLNGVPTININDISGTGPDNFTTYDECIFNQCMGEPFNGVCVETDDNLNSRYTYLGD